jgi:ATP adenylyltransferase
MDRMYAPWRLAYASGAAKDPDPPVLRAPSGCIFCDYPTADNTAVNGDVDRARLIVCTRTHAFVILNKYPYTNAHLMVVPRLHVENVDELPHDASAGLHALLMETMSAVRDEYRPDGMNIGMNVGAAAGAGIAPHCHWHVVPRWKGDVNFMPVLAHTRVILESLDDTWLRMRSRLQ